MDQNLFMICYSIISDKVSYVDFMKRNYNGSFKGTKY